MKLSDLDFVKLLPQFMREDGAVIGLSKGLDSIVPSLAASMQLLTTWDHIDDLAESELDDLAVELRVLWYDTGATIETKRDLIRNSMEVYRHLGTKWAVESVIYSYFGDGYVAEWFDYDGDPGHFRVYSANPSLTNEKMTDFLNLLGKVKRASSILDGVYINLTGQTSLYAGAAIHETGRDLYAIGAQAL